MEHNALIIFDPATITDSALLTAPATNPDSPPIALVFDPWFCGEPAIYSVPDWSKLSFDGHPVGIDSRPFPVGQVSPPTRRDTSPAW